MGKGKTFYYLVDKLTKNNTYILRAALKTIPEISKVNLRVAEGILEITSSRDIKEKIIMTCQVTGTPFRTQVKKRDL